MFVLLPKFFPRNDLCVCFYRIEKVIEDLENIKETVNHQKAFGEEGLLETARPESVTPLTHR